MNPLLTVEAFQTVDNLFEKNFKIENDQKPTPLRLIVPCCQILSQASGKSQLIKKLSDGPLYIPKSCMKNFHYFYSTQYTKEKLECQLQRRSARLKQSAKTVGWSRERCQDFLILHNI
uniref:Uncharacterized protein n=1 Tax=Romanomermis culicivorax TaxID=13658 RepID=A0A915HPQ3_ROMCU